MSSVYFWDVDDGFAGVVLLKKGRTINAETILGNLEEKFVR